MLLTKGKAVPFHIQSRNQRSACFPQCLSTRIWKEIKYLKKNMFYHSPPKRSSGARTMGTATSTGYGQGSAVPNVAPGLHPLGKALCPEQLSPILTLPWRRQLQPGPASSWWCVRVGTAIAAAGAGLCAGTWIVLPPAVTGSV